MASRKGNKLDVNDPVRGNPDKNVQSKYDSDAAAAEAEADRMLNATDAAALDDTQTMQEADARREVPRMRTDSANPRKGRSLPNANETRGMLSSRMKKENAKTKGAWQSSLPGTRRQAISRVASDPQRLEDTNRVLRATHGTVSEAPPAIEKAIRRQDRAIQDYERINEREHVVYAVMKPPKDHGNSRNAVERRLNAMAEDKNSAPLAFDGYIPSSHSLGNLNPGPNDIVMEIRTRSGAYLGSSDTLPDADHIVGRGRSMRVSDVQDVEYIKPDGSTGRHRLVQLDDVTDDGRTTATR